MTARHIPQVFLTSNNTRDLSEALKRRCLFLHLGYPTVEREAEIVQLHVPELAEHLAGEIAALVAVLRSADLKKPPSISESVDWARTMIALGAAELTDEVTRQTLPVLLKYERDIHIALAELLPRLSPMQTAALATLVDELRTAGVGVSVGEHLDAARALASIPLRDTEVVRACLQSSLVKRAEHLDAFNLLFELYFLGTGSSDLPQLAGLTEAELAAALRAAIGSDDAGQLRLLAAEYVRRFAELEPGAPVAGVFAMIAVSEAANLDGIRADMLSGDGQSGQADPDGSGQGGTPGGGDGAGAGGGGGSGAGLNARSAAIRDRLDRASADRSIESFLAQVQAAIRRTLVADRGPRAVTRTMRVRLAEDVDIANASAAELAAMASSIGPLAQRLTKILAQQAYRKRRLSVRRTLHLAMGTGGVPFRLATEPAPPPRPDIVVLCDVSGSVASFSRFTLNLLIALDSRLSRLRVFSFVDGLAEITELVSEARSAGRQLGSAEAARGAVRFSGSSDYGHVLREFASQYSPQFSRRTVLLVVGDARTNYLDPGAGALAEISQRVGKLYWLNPERRQYWNQGDSVIARYSPWCAQVRECRTLRQIADFVHSLAAGPAAAG